MFLLLGSVRIYPCQRDEKCSISAYLLSFVDGNGPPLSAAAAAALLASIYLSLAPALAVQV